MAVNAPDKTRILRLAIAQQAVLFLINFGQNVVVARLLAPREIGAYSVAMAAIIVANVLKSAGVPNFLIQEKDLSPAKVRSALGLTCAVAFTLAAVVATAGPAVAEFYGNEQIGYILIVAAATLAVSPFQQMAVGLLSRALRFGTILSASVAGSTSAAVTAIVLILCHWGPVSLAWADLANGVAATVVMICSGVPGFAFRPSGRGWRAVWRISGWTMASSLLNQVGGRSSELVLAKTLGLQASAFYDRAEVLPRLVWNYLWPALSNVLTSVLAHEIRGGENPRSVALPRMRYLSALFVPGMMMLGTQSESILLTIYGDQWEPAVPAAFWICLYAAIVSPFVASGSLLIALGRTRALFLLYAVEQAVRLPVLLALSGTDIVTVATIINLAAVAYAAAAIAVMRHYGIMRLDDLVPTLSRPLAIGLIVAVAGFAFQGMLAEMLGSRYMLRAVVGLLALGVVWLGAVWVFDRSLLVLLLRVVPGGRQLFPGKSADLA